MGEGDEGEEGNRHSRADLGDLGDLDEVDLMAQADRTMDPKSSPAVSTTMAVNVPNTYAQ